MNFLNKPLNPLHCQREAGEALKSTSEPILNPTPETTPNPTPVPTTIPSTILISTFIPTFDPKSTSKPLLSSKRRGRPPKRMSKCTPNVDPKFTSTPTPNPIPIYIFTPMPNPTPEVKPILNPTPILTPNGIMRSTSETNLEPTSNPTIPGNSKPNPERNPTSEATPKFTPIRENSKSTATYSLRQARRGSTFDSYWTKEAIACEPDKWFDITVEDRELALPGFCPKQPPGPQLVMERDYTPLQLFQLFFTNSGIETIVRNTNCYAEKRAEAGKKFLWVPLTVKEFHSYLALVVYMGLVKAKSLVDYWARKMMYNFSYPQSVMSRARFQAISWNLYLCDPQEDEENNKKKGTPGYDQLHKIKPLYTEIVSACMTHFHPNREITVDERMDATKSKIGLKRYLKDMPTNWGYRLFVLADSSSRYTWNFFVYDGKSSMSTGKGVGYDAVMRLLDHELLGTGYRLYANNFYTSTTLFLDLWQNNILACGTLRHTSSLPEVSDVSRRAERGSIHWCRQGPLLFLKWMDMKEVVLCSTMHKAYVGDTISWNVKDNSGDCSERHIPIPPAVKDYNKFMGDLDLSDALMEYYNVVHKTKKWYKNYFFHFLEIAVENSYILHQQMAKVQNKTPLSQKVFRETLVSELEHVGKGKKPLTSASQDPTSVLSAPDSLDMESSLPASLFSFTWTEQCFPEYFGSDITYGMKNCVLCRLSGHKVQTPIFCTYCRVPLCFESSRNCFKKWHIKGCAI
ncbi:piggyBac transposable element-derived protein 4-like isoform X1 [Myxocyprinus asiaticus]|uniref:piggyBac transposable element-derived protein 4-like isoform X1 n=1 Tax=Myxocyprinus asiaticus TaxID=70543 RepID=UPI002222A514|nr:piggyBac transposable element-derived protein 4-like isoform X1 [Myxocyprinus asiaticus]XP_051511238.1 piggyBac transposable element-derived protein 4-like isoform X1 [Myxocyprinus asiaticus]